jgi:hypothetical protein
MEQEINKECPLHFYIKDGVLFGECCKPFTMDLPTANLLLESRLKVNKGKTYPAFFDFGTVEHSDSETRDFLLTRGTELLSACAFITTNPAFRIFLNSVFLLYRTRVPMRVFSTKEKAVVWLKEYTIKEQEQSAA